MELLIAFVVFMAAMLAAIIFDFSMIAALFIGLIAFMLAGKKKGFSFLLWPKWAMRGEKILSL